MKPRAAREISGSAWSIGCEVLDRDLADYQKFRQYLGPLGAKQARLQAGWAKTEQQAGVFDFKWLDAIVDDMRGQGVQPWLQLSYGNPIYPGGGGRMLGDGVPQSPAALAAWDNWVRAVVRHFRGRIEAWEVWNEPDGSTQMSVIDYANLFTRTAEIIRAEQPEGKIYALSLSTNVVYAEAFLLCLREQGKVSLIDAITYHGYPMNPDDTSLADQLRAVLQRHALEIPIRQGETGAPSARGTSGALGGFPGSEVTQAKWILRRMLAHHARGIPFNLFLLMEFDYAGQPHTGMNSKGLLKANADKSVAYPKQAYQAVQNVCTLFDDTFVRVPNFAYHAYARHPLAVTGYRQKITGAPLIALWYHGEVPTESLEPSPYKVDLLLDGMEFKDPVIADLRTGVVYEFPANHVSTVAPGRVLVRKLPVYDSPIVLAERSMVLRK
ncbi:MAG: hypothetical protein JNN01_11490 [Opitutaceae bacterium]|nr:hypothetical protein [Opitutaceae bacterium]